MGTSTKGNSGETPAPDAQKNRKKKGKKDGPGSGAATPADEEGGQPNGQGQRRNNAGGKKVNGQGGIVNLPPPVVVSPSQPEAEAAPVTPGIDSALDPAAKKARNLNKKLKAIEELKEKQKRGERLEATQLRKIDGEAEIRKELAALGI
ncbi:hypothetical protein NLJ89_g6848 [Agrocybe chaxingu]|uniref:Uncharacterized protein n=1 Tax=Agrocybe chaxingu TaxID=84603 RepID=A0A9W8MW09_9AGAR|nr:hypothetical protein NLJ89_g6848 [Agrocybe chaxingu]